MKEKKPTPIRAILLPPLRGRVLGPLLPVPSFDVSGRTFYDEVGSPSESGYIVCQTGYASKGLELKSATGRTFPLFPCARLPDLAAAKFFLITIFLSRVNQR